MVLRLAELGGDGQVVGALHGGGIASQGAAAVAGVHAVKGALAGLLQVVHVQTAVHRGVFAGRLVADVLVAVLNADEEPADAAAEGLEDIPQVDGVPQGSHAEEATHARAVLVYTRRIGGVQVRVGVEGARGVVGVRAPGEGPQVEDGEEGHLEAEEQRRNADLDIGIGERRVGFDDVQGTGPNADGEALPERQEDDQLDGQDFEERSVRSKSVLELDVKLDDAIHGDEDGHRFNHENLGQNAG